MGRHVEFPEVVEVIELGIPAPEKPEISAEIKPGDSAKSRSGDIGRIGYTFGPINAGLIDRVAAGDPDPFTVRGIVLPEVIEHAVVHAVRAIAHPSEEPEGAAGIQPRYGVSPGPRDI